jgi:hypothetical protein
MPDRDNSLSNVSVVRGSPVVKQHFPILADATDLPKGLLKPGLIQNFD